MTRARAARPGLALMLTAVLWATGSSSWALDPERRLSQYAVDRWTSEDGLPQNFIEALAQTPDGYLWIGTQNGLARFDGHEFVTFDTDNTPSLSINRVADLLVDRQGRLWVATTSELVRHDGRRFERIDFDDGRPIDVILDLFEDRDGRVWLGRPGAELAVVDGNAAAVFRDAEGATLVDAVSIAQTDSGTLCFASFEATCLKAGRLEPIAMPARPRALAGAGESIQVLTFGGLRAMDPRLGTERLLLELPEQVAYRMRRDRDGGSWLMTNTGVTRWYEGQDAPLPGDFVPAQARCVLEDHEGSLWIGTEEGLLRLRANRFDVISEPEGLHSRHAHAIFEDADGAIWVSTADLGLQRRTADGWVRFDASRGVTHDVLAIWQDPDGTILIATGGGGVSRLRGDRFEAVPGGPSVAFCVAIDRTGKAWLGSARGLGCYEDGRFCQPDWIEPGTAATMVHAAGDGAIWIGSNQGVVRRWDGSELTTYDQDDGLLRGATVLSAFEDEDGTVWIATYGGGLLRFADGDVSRFTTDDGLPTDGWYAVIGDGRGMLWLSSDRGLAAVSRRALDRRARGEGGDLGVRLFGQADGMRSVECNGGYSPSVLRARDDRLWFPTADGLVIVDPDRLERAAVDPPLLLERLIAGGKELDLSEAATSIPADDRNVEFHYDGISFLAPESLRYRYRLAGYDRDWVEAGTRRVAYYTHLPPGRFTFEVQVRNTDGAWSDRVASASIVVRAHYHETAWFWVAVLALTGGTLYAIHRVRVRRLLGIERVRTRIATDLHDDLGASLSRISILSEVARARIDRDGERAKEALRTIGETARGLVDQTSDIVWSIDPAQDDLASVVTRIRALANDLFQESGTRCVVEASGDVDGTRLSIDRRRHLYLILKEALVNAARHAGAAEVRVSVERRTDRIEARVADDGRGWDPASTGTTPALGGNGLRNMKGRAAEIGGTLSYESVPGGGTTIALSIPAR